jgi:hypothetical protein
MEEYKYIIPLDGLLIRDPHTKAIIPPEGATIPWIGPEGRYWRRRVKDGSCIMYNEKPKKKVEKIVQKTTIKKVDNIDTKKVDKE